MSQEAPRHWRAIGWKVGFFVALFAFEVAREWAVVASADEPKLATIATVTNWNGLVTAEGRWTRIDDGQRLTPNIVRIECWQDRGECNEVFVQVNGDFVGAPTINTFKAKFSPEAVTYENDGSICVHYSTRIDLRLKKAFAVRTKKESNDPNCRRMESRIEMQLGDGWRDAKDSLKGHFLPVFDTLAALVKLF
jgi:hypothetical protein